MPDANWMQSCTWRHAAGVALLTWGSLLASGCEKPVPPGPAESAASGEAAPTNQPAQPTVAGNSAADPADAAASKIFKKAGFKDWPKPAFALALSGELHGYIEPCGCSDPQYGGIARRDEFLRQLQEKGWELAAFDLGGTVKNARSQSKSKLQTLLASMRDMPYRGMVIGTEELKLGASWLVSQDPEPEPGQEKTALRFLSANVVLFGSPDLATPARHRIVTVGGRKIGVTAIYSPALKAKLGNIDESEIEISDPVPAIKKALASLKAEGADFRVLMAHAGLSESQKLAEQFPEFQVVVSLSPVEEPLTDNPLTVGDSLVVQVGHKGKYVGLLGFYPDEQPAMRFDLTRLDGDRFPNSKRMIAHMQFYQDMLEDEKLAETEPALRHPKNAKFVGAEKCGECHTKAFEKWKSTGHAKGFESLKTGRLGISRTFDPECLACHTTGWQTQDVLRYETGYENPQKSAHLFGNQCENCHGPGSKHIELIEADKKLEARALMKLDLAQAEKNVCSNCHDNDNSPHFKFEDYWKKIAHPGLD